jgi:FAD/FMN-containing dehydrogenase
MSTSAAIVDLKNRLQGQLLVPSDGDYDAARKVWNGMIDKHPALIVRCAGPKDIAACIEFSRETGVPLSVRGGGHNFGGKAICDGGLTLDLSLMRSTNVDTARRTVRAQTGLKLGELDAATQQYGLATPLGVATTTGISGLTLGGGYGWLAGKYALACDNLTWASVVTADGKLIECSEQQNEDLFWGLRGAGPNFGVVTEMEFRLHPVTTVLAGPIFHPLTRQACRFFDELARDAPDELTLLGSAMMGPGGVPAFATVVCYCGPAQEGEKLIEPLRTYAPPIADMIQMRPYLEMQSLFDATYPPGRRYYDKAHNLTMLTEEIVDVVLHYIAKLPTPGSSIAFQQLHGAAGRVPATATAFPHRYDHHVVWIDTIGDNPADDEKMIRWTRECWQAMQPYVDQAIYVNALNDEADTGERPVREAYGANYERLRDLKTKFDPANVFRQNSNIAPRQLDGRP